MAKVYLNLWVNGPPSDQLGTVHGTLKKFACADLAVEMDLSAITYREVAHDELNPLWQVNGKEIRMFSMDIDPTQLDYVLTAGCQPIIDIGANATSVGTDEYDLAYAPGGTFRNAGLTSIPADWYVCGHTKYYVKTVVPDSLNEVTWNCYKPVGWTETSSQYSPISFDSAHPEKYYVTDSPAAIDIYFNSAAHFGIGAYNEAEVFGAYDSCSIRRFFGPNMYTWRPTYPTLSGSSPGYWNAYWDLGNGYPGTRVFGAADLTDILDGSYATRYKYYAFAHQYDPDNTGAPETYIGFLFTIENALGQITSASALIMTQDIASGVIKTPDGGYVSGIEGGDGEWDDGTSESGDLDGEEDSANVTRWNSVWSGIDSGYNKYVWHFVGEGTDAAPAFNEFISNLFKPTSWQAWQQLNYNPLQGVVACHMLPHDLAPTTTGVSAKIQAAGTVLSDSDAPVFGAEMLTYKHFDAVSLKKYMGSFADISNTEIYIHLPYIGDIQLDNKILTPSGSQADDKDTTAISVDYFCDVWSGDCCAKLTVKDCSGAVHEKYEFRGNCAKPVSLYQYSPKSAKVIQAAATNLADMSIDIVANQLQFENQEKYASDIGKIKFLSDFDVQAAKNAGGIASLGTKQAQRALKTAMNSLAGDAALRAVNRADYRSGLINSIANPVKSFVNSTLNATSQVTSSNNSTGSANLPVIDEIYLTIVRPVWSNPSNYAELLGYPSDIGGTIEHGADFAPFEGYLQVRTIKLDGIPAENSEKEEIERLLKTGVYIGTRT